MGLERYWENTSDRTYYNAQTTSAVSQMRQKLAVDPQHPCVVCIHQIAYRFGGILFTRTCDTNTSAMNDYPDIHLIENGFCSRSNRGLISNIKSHGTYFPATAKRPDFHRRITRPRVNRIPILRQQLRSRKPDTGRSSRQKNIITVKKVHLSITKHDTFCLSPNI
jgi:hypothetical protein